MIKGKREKEKEKGVGRWGEGGPYLGGIELVGDIDLVAVNDELSVVNNDRAGVAAVHSVVVEHVLHVVNGDEGIVDCDDLDVWVVASCAHDQAANATKTVDSDLDGHC